MIEHSIRLTTAATADLCAQLDCAMNADDLDGALADAGYARLDHGLEPAETTVFTPMDPPAGRDPGHRGPALAYAHCLMHIAHADGAPTTERLRACVEIAVDAAPTDHVGETLVAALATYASRRDPGPRPIHAVADTVANLRAAARGAYAAARSGNVLTDLALGRAEAVGEGVDGWLDALYANMRITDQVVRARRHDAADYERAGIEPPLAEMIAWLRAHPEADVPEFERQVRMAGMDPRETANRIADALGRLSLPAPGQAMESGGPSSST